MISSKNSYALFNRGTIKIPSPVNSPVRPWKRESFFSHALDVKTVLAASREVLPSQQYRLFDSISRCKGSAI